MQEIGKGTTCAGESAKNKISRRTIVAGAAWATPVVMLASASPALAASPQLVSCPLDDSFYHTKGGGKFLNGSLFGLNLDTLVAVRGIDVENIPVLGAPGVIVNPSNNVVPVEITGRPEGDIIVDAYANPLQVDVLSSLSVSLGGVTQPLGQIMNFADTGVYNQFGYARENGASAGFAGIVADSGGVTLNAVTGRPDFANINLKTVVSRLVGGSLAGLVDQVASLNLNIGAVGARAELDSCYNTATREYVIASSNLTVGSNALATVLEPVIGDNGAIKAVENAVNGLVGTNGLLTQTVTEIVEAVPGIISSIPIVGPIVRLKTNSQSGNFAVSVDLKPVRDLLKDPVGTGALKLSLVDADEMVFVDIDKLVGSLNNKAANTRVLPANPVVIDPLIDDIADLLDALPTNVTKKLWEQLNKATVKLNLELTLQYRNLIPVDGPLGWQDAATLTLGVDTTLGGLIAGDASVTVSLKGYGSFGSTLIALVDVLLNAPLKLLVDPILDATGILIKDLLDPLVDDVGGLLGAPVKAVLTGLIDPLLKGLLGGGSVPGLIEMTVNVQEGAYDVAALELGILPGGSGVDIVLARAYAGENIAV